MAHRANETSATAPQIVTVFYEPDIDELVVAHGDSPAMDLVDVVTDVEVVFDHEVPGRLILITIRGARLRDESDVWTTLARTLLGETIWSLYCTWRDDAEDSFVRTARTETTSTTVSVAPEEFDTLTEVWSVLHVSYDDLDEMPRPRPGPSTLALVARPPDYPEGDEIDLWPPRELVLVGHVAERFGLGTPGTVEFRNAFTVSVTFDEVDGGTAVPRLDIVEPCGTTSRVQRDEGHVTFEFDLDYPAAPYGGLSFLLSEARST